MEVFRLPDVKAEGTIDDVQSIVVKFYKDLGWDGTKSINVRQAKINKQDYMNIAETLKSLATDKEQETMIVMLWGTYAPSVDDSVKPGTIKLLKGFISYEEVLV